MIEYSVENVEKARGYGAKMKATFTTCFLILALFLTACSISDVNKAIDIAKELNEQETQPTTIDVSKYTLSYDALITKCADGDTCTAVTNGVEETIRMIGIDTPESVHPSKPVECYSLEASNYTKQELVGKMVILEDDKTQESTDKYGRSLRYIYYNKVCKINGDCQADFFNLNVIKKGYGKEYTYSKAYKYQAAFKDAQEQAKNSSAGLWGACSG